MSGKRTDYIGWDECFMEMAFTIAKRSKDPSTQVGACIIDTTNRVISVGYNGFPNGCSDDEFTWEKAKDKVSGKHLYVVHAELNAILNAKKDLTNCTLYVTHYPCNECAKAIIQSGIKTVIFQHFYNKNAMAVYDMFSRADVKVYKYDSRDGIINDPLYQRDIKLLISEFESNKLIESCNKKPISDSLDELKEYKAKKIDPREYYNSNNNIYKPIINEEK